MFILDKALPEFQFNNPYYAKLPKQDSFLTVFKEGLVGYYVNTSTDFKDMTKTAAESTK